MTLEKREINRKLYRTIFLRAFCLICVFFLEDDRPERPEFADLSFVFEEFSTNFWKLNFLTFLRIWKKKFTKIDSAKTSSALGNL